MGLVLAPILALTLGACAAPMPPSMSHPLLGQAGPPFEAVSLDNQSVLVPAFGGAKATVLDFWASSWPSD